MSSAKRTKSLPNAVIAAKSQPTPPSRSAEKIADNDDLLIEILLRLPIKSLIKFKSVSKRWLSLVSDPDFSLRRFSVSISTPISGLFFRRSSRSVTNVSEFDFVNLNLTNSSKSPFRSLPSAARIIQSCNGLLLCCSNRALDPRENFIFNPTTKQYNQLPPICRFRDDANWTLLGLSLAFDPGNSPHHKVICVRNCRERHNWCQIDIYSSATRCWRLFVESFYMESHHHRFDGGVYWNGSVHWISVWSESLYFNVEQERISLLPMPPVPEDRRYLDPKYRYFGESRGHLHLIDYIYDLQRPRFDVLEMEMDYSGWFVKFRVDLSDIPSSFPQIVRRKLLHRQNLHDYVFSVLCVVRGELDEESYLVLQIPGKVIRYNLRTGTFFKLCDLEPNSSTKTDRDAISVSMMFPELIDWTNAHQFYESLALV